MQVKFPKLFLVSVLLVSLCISCGSPEEKARAMLNEALLLKNQEKFLEAGSLLREIVSEYPQTKVATEAAGVLDQIKVGVLGQLVLLEDREKYLEARELCKEIASEYPGIASRFIAKCNDVALRDLKNAYVAAQAYFVESGLDGKVDLLELLSQGLRANNGTKIEVLKGTWNDLQMTGEHLAGDTVYTVSADGDIEHNRKE